MTAGTDAEADPGPSLFASVAALVLAAAGAWATVVRPRAPSWPAVATNLDQFDDALVQLVATYRGPRVAVALLSLVLSIAVPALVVGTQRGRSLLSRVAAGRGESGMVESLARSSALATSVRGGLVGAGLVLAVRLALLPATWWVGHAREVDWGFRTASGVDWFRDWFLAVGLEMALAAVAGGLWLVLVAWRRRDWHWWLVVASTALAGLLVLLQPLVVQPLFLQTRALPPGDLRDRLEEVLEVADVPAEILVGDASRRTTRVNAFVTGLGPTRQVVLWDNLLDLPASEVAVIVAHELAHREHGDIPRGVLLTATGALPFALVLRRVFDRAGRSTTGALRHVPEASDPRAVAVLVLAIAVGQVAGLPAAMWASRQAEAAADARAVEWTADPTSLVTTFRGFVVRDLASPTFSLPARLFLATHPSIGERIRAVAAGAAHLELPLPPLSVLEDAERPQRHPGPRS